MGASVLSVLSVRFLFAVISLVHYLKFHTHKETVIYALMSADKIGQDPYFYIPKSAFIRAVLEEVDPTTEKCYWLAKLSSGGKSTDRVLVFDASTGLKDLVRIEVSALGSSSSFAFFIACSTS